MNDRTVLMDVPAPATVTPEPNETRFRHLPGRSSAAAILD